MPCLTNPVHRHVAAACLGVAALLMPSRVSGQPIPPETDRRSFLITETSVSTLVSRTELSSDVGSLTLELGYAWNRGEHSALGGTVFLKGGELVTGVGARPRYRRWLDRHLALDVSPGARFSSNGSDFKTDFSGQLALSYREIGVVLEADTGDEDSRLYWSLGGRLGGWPGVIGGVGFLVLALLFAASYSGVGS